MTALPMPLPDADLERRFGALRRLYGPAGYARVRAASVCVVGVGGVGSWAAEALARSGVASLTLVDMDHVAESNVNRQVQALSPTLGASKVLALQERVQLIHPGCKVHAVEEFVTQDNWPALLPASVDAVIDACDQVRAKAALAYWALQQRAARVAAAHSASTPLAFVSVGAAGGKQRPQDVCVEDLARATHDPLLAALRQRVRKLGAARTGVLDVACVFSREPVARPQNTPAGANGPQGEAGDAGEAEQCEAIENNLNCHGYGSSVTVTATFGMVAAAEVLRQLLAAM